MPLPTSMTAVPLPIAPVTVRPATADDLPFIDALQKKHAKQVGWMPKQQLEQKIAAGNVLVAVGATPASPGRGTPGFVGATPASPVCGDGAAGFVSAPVGATPASPAFAGAGAGTGDAGVAPTWHIGYGAHAGRPGDAGVAPTGYVIASDRYFKRDDVGIVYQMNVVPGRSAG